jgi:hypothetical protein
MSRIILVLVLLVTWSLASVPSFTPSALAGTVPNPVDEISDDFGGVDAGQNGAPGDGSEGDPGDAGDGYGVTGGRIMVATNSGDHEECDAPALEEYLFFLAVMVQQLAP